MRKSEYLNKDAAAKRTGLSIRRLLELAHRGTIHKRFVKDPKSKREIAVFAVDDLDRVKEEKKYWKMGNREFRPLLSSDAASVATVPHTNNLGESKSENDTPKRVREWMTLAEADAYIGLPEGFLLIQVKAGKLPALDVGVRPGGRWRVSKRDLESIVAEEQKCL